MGVIGGRDILVDGYNVIKRNPAFQAALRQSLAAARQQLISQLGQRYRQTPHQVVIVFDGDDVREQVSHEQGIRIIFSPRGETADRVIARLASDARRTGREVELYSDDGDVQQAVAQQGGVARKTEQLTRQLNTAPRDVARRARHRIAMRHKYGLDASSGVDKKDVDDEAYSYRVPGKKKKKRR